MNKADITCRITKDTLIRYIVLVLALFGLGVYFFYDALIGYPKQNEAYFSYQAFAKAGAEATNYTPEEWQQKYAKQPLVERLNKGKKDYYCVLDENSVLHPIPPAKAGDETCPEILLNHALISTDWHQAWLDYSAQQHYPSKPQHAYNNQDVAAQIYAGVGCFFLGFLLFCLIQLKARKSITLHGNKLSILGKEVAIADITSIDLRQWGIGYKGRATLITAHKSYLIDGMSYGGFNPKYGKPAQVLMEAILTQYKGEIINYAAQDQ